MGLVDDRRLLLRKERASEAKDVAHLHTIVLQPKVWLLVCTELHKPNYPSCITNSSTQNRRHETSHDLQYDYSFTPTGSISVIVLAL